MSTTGEWLKGWEAELVDHCKVARLGTIGQGGLPHIVPVCFARLGDTFYIPIDEKPKAGRQLARVSNILRDPRSTLLVDRYDDAWTSLAWVRIECTALIHDRGDHEPAALSALRERYPQYRAMALEERPLIVLIAARVVSWRWQR